MKVIIAQISTTNGDITGNALRIVAQVVYRILCGSKPSFTVSAGFLVFCAYLGVFNATAHSQPEPRKVDDRVKDFGHSLDKYKTPGKRIGQTAKKDATPKDDTIRVSTDMVVTDVLVVNKDGKAIVGLNKDDFLISEDGVAQETDLFAPGDNTIIPKTIVLIIELGGLPSWALRSTEAAKGLVDKLGPKDRMALVTTRLRMISDFTDDKQFLKAKLDATKKEHWSGMYNYSTLVASLNELFTRGDKRPIIIQQSYGDEVVRLKPMLERAKGHCTKETPFLCERDFGLPEVNDTIERSRATIYTIAPEPQVIGPPPDEQTIQVRKYLNRLFADDPLTDRKLPSEKAKEDFRSQHAEVGISDLVRTETALISTTALSGGFASFIEKEEDIDDVYNMIFKSIHCRYTIGYYPDDERHDGERRTVKIEVRGHPEYRVIGRKTYFAPDK